MSTRYENFKPLCMNLFVSQVHKMFMRYRKRKIGSLINKSFCLHQNCKIFQRCKSITEHRSARYASDFTWVDRIVLGRARPTPCGFRFSQCQVIAPIQFNGSNLNLYNTYIKNKRWSMHNFNHPSPPIVNIKWLVFYDNSIKTMLTKCMPTNGFPSRKSVFVLAFKQVFNI